MSINFREFSLYTIRMMGEGKIYNQILVCVSVEKGMALNIWCN